MLGVSLGRVLDGPHRPRGGVLCPQGARRRQDVPAQQFRDWIYKLFMHKKISQYFCFNILWIKYIIISYYTSKLH